tara:strand:+ start:128 stop:310 length:183 start_codon:yes stop_codon:yes gene_type:complete
MPRYSIFWKSTITGYKGKGTHAFENKSIINEIINEMNEKYLDIQHYYKEVPLDTPLMQIL